MDPAPAPGPGPGPGPGHGPGPAPGPGPGSAPGPGVWRSSKQPVSDPAEVVQGPQEAAEGPGPPCGAAAPGAAGSSWCSWPGTRCVPPELPSESPPGREAERWSR